MLPMTLYASVAQTNIMIFFYFYIKITAVKESSDVISESPMALQLRYLQTLNTITDEKNFTIIFQIANALLTSLPALFPSNPKAIKGTVSLCNKFISEKKSEKF